MAAQKKRSATAKVASKKKVATKKVASKKVAAKKVAAKPKLSVVEVVESPKTAADAGVTSSFHISSAMNSVERQAVISASLVRWEDFIKLPVRQLTEGELQMIISDEFARVENGEAPRIAVVKRAHSAYGVIRNRRERDELEARSKELAQQVNDNG